MHLTTDLISSTRYQNTNEKRRQKEQVETEPLVHINVGLLADDVGEAAPDTLDGGHSEHDFLLPVHVRVLHTQNVLELFICYQRLQNKKFRQLGYKQKDQSNKNHKYKKNRNKNQSNVRG